ncbi:hypothetical protein ZEAMMB73_Zm00001d024611 [Zea mays]|uniref:Uncharacterized protein n=1 Tax=Zea mays TaxID=4577 RepID=K7UFQ2_MAIZE|nr:hypothetical protein ZEAMMB73_Zm00001d024611 [Zea mays]
MAKCLKHTTIHALWLVAIVLLASSVVLHARIISRQTKENSNTRSLTMTMMGPASNIIGTGVGNFLEGSALRIMHSSCA